VVYLYVITVKMSLVSLRGTGIKCHMFLLNVDYRNACRVSGIYFNYKNAALFAT